MHQQNFTIFFSSNLSVSLVLVLSPCPRKGTSLTGLSGSLFHRTVRCCSVDVYVGWGGVGDGGSV